MGHALRKALGVLAAGQGRGLADGVADLAGKAGTPMLAASSLKAAPAWIRSPQPLVSIRPSA
jgi:transposase